MGSSSGDSARLVSLDQYRGYTVLGMFVVNFLSVYAVVPAVLKHHNTYCSYADTIMPQFFFAAGMAARLTWVRRAADGRVPALRRALRRNLGLILLGLLLYGLDVPVTRWDRLRELGPWGVLTQGFQREPFQTLVHLGVTGLWTLPVLGAPPRVRGLFLVASAGLHLGLSWRFYYEWVWHRPGIDGGPLGFLSWTIPYLAGTLALDAVARPGGGLRVRPLAWWAVGLMVLGYGLACLNRVTPPHDPSAAGQQGLAGLLVEPPFVPPGQPVNLWTMSQRTGSVSYQVFAAGLSLAVYAGFRAACDGAGWRVHYLDLLGRHALAGYVLHGAFTEALGWCRVREVPAWVALTALAVSVIAVTVCLRVLDRRGIFLRL